MSYPFRISLAIMIALIALVFLLLGVFEINDPTSVAPSARRLFFSLAAICAGAAAGVVFA